MQIYNDGDTDVAMKDLSLRYWYADDSGKPQNYWCDWAKVGQQNATGRFVTLLKPRPGAACCLELTFDAAAGNLAANASSGEIQCRLARNDWSNYNQADDYSFNAEAKDWTDQPRISLYQRGKLVWGQEPGGAGKRPAQAELPAAFCRPHAFRPRGTIRSTRPASSRFGRRCTTRTAATSAPKAFPTIPSRRS